MVIEIFKLLTDLFALLLIFRFLLQLVQADFFNPLSQAVHSSLAPIEKVFFGHGSCAVRSAFGLRPAVAVEQNTAPRSAHAAGGLDAAGQADLRTRPRVNT